MTRAQKAAEAFENGREVRARKGYINTLQEENAALKAEIAGLREGIGRLESYLSLPKFREDPTVQVSDIFLRLEEIKTGN